VLIVGILHWAREVLMPIALAVLLSFILSPIVSLLRRRGLGQGISVAFTVVLAFLLIGSIGMLIVSEFKGLANELPGYQQNIRRKIADLHVAVKTGSLGKLRQTMQEVMKEFKKEDPLESEPKSAAPIPVVVKDTGATLDLAFVKALLGPAVTATLVVVLVVFMLLRREDLRDRLLQMAGYGRMVVTSKAIDEAGKQVSRYLLRQFLVNTGFGIVAGAGFGLMGLPYALLWGFFAGVARFVPYLGAVLGVAGPILMSLAVSDGWTALLMVFGFFVSLELLAGMVIEPLVYGEGIGVSEVALLIMIAFWTWLWGAIGLVLATPLTVCLMVISKSVPNLRFITVLFNREPTLDVPRMFYHRLIAHEEEEARNVVETFLGEHSESELFEQLLIPTLIACRHDHQWNKLTGEDQEFIFQIVRQIIEEDHESKRARTANDIRPANGEIEGRLPEGKPSIVGFPANDEADELALLMLAKLFGDERWRMRVLSTEILSGEALAEAEKIQPQPVVFCVGLLPQGPTLPARQLCKRLRSRFPDRPVLLGLWGASDQKSTRDRFSGVATEIGWTLLGTKNQLIQFGQMGKTPDPKRDDAWLDRRGEAPESIVVKATAGTLPA
jgi:predicted PurR-regulated permease PerM